MDQKFGGWLHGALAVALLFSAGVFSGNSTVQAWAIGCAAAAYLAETAAFMATDHGLSTGAVAWTAMAASLACFAFGFGTLLFG